MLSLVLHYRMKPHHQEKYVFLVDAGSMSFSIMTYYYMEKFMEWISIVFAGLCDKILVYNADKVGFVWDICKRWLLQSTVSKVIFVTKNNIAETHKLIEPAQL
jgi:hypothetical protein